MKLVTVSNSSGKRNTYAKIRARTFHCTWIRLKIYLVLLKLAEKGECKTITADSKGISIACLKLLE